jgi:2-methylaconitate cis-trans-isomerase PrpF
MEFPVHHVRGGTSTGLVIAECWAPREQSLREELLRHLMGLPLEGTRPGNRQITGLGRIVPTGNKVFFARLEAEGNRRRIVSTFAQLAADKAAIDWSVNCGNMTAALPLWALDTGHAEAGGEAFEIDIFNTNTGVTAGSRMRFAPDGGFVPAEIPGVDGAFPAVDLFLANPVGAKTGRLLPTDRSTDDIAGYAVSCVDVAVPMVIARAGDFGKTAREPPEALEGDRDFMAALRAVWVEAGLRMGLKTTGGRPMTAEQLAQSETIPKVCIVGPPSGSGHIAVRYFTPQTAPFHGRVRRLLSGGGRADSRLGCARVRARTAAGAARVCRGGCRNRKPGRRPGGDDRGTVAGFGAGIAQGGLSPQHTNPDARPGAVVSRFPSPARCPAASVRLIGAASPSP